MLIIVSFKTISGEWMLSEETERFGEIAHMKRIDFIKAKLTKETLLGNSNNT